MSVIELVLFTVLIGAAAWASVILGERFGVVGYLVGIPAGIGVVYGVVCILYFLDRMRRGDDQRLPKCRKGICSGKDYTAVQAQSGERVWQCKCGQKYCSRGRKFMEVDEEGNTYPYLEWIPFAGWKKED